jgi:pimeloyl-ACP methyl ester carboxylesterase
MRGAGMSEKVSGTLDINLLCDDMAVLLDALGITGKVIAAGAAVGGAIAVHFAIRHPNCAAKIILTCPAFGVPPEQDEAALAIVVRIRRTAVLIRRILFVVVSSQSKKNKMRSKIRMKKSGSIGNSDAAH